MAFIDSKTLGETESAKRLIENRVASRMAAKDGSDFDFDPAAAECANTRLGWTTLASEPPTDPAQIVICERWENAAVLAAHEATKHFTTLLPQIGDLASSVDIDKF